MEIWKDIKGYEGYYMISNKGRVKSLVRKIYSGVNYSNVRIKPENILVPKVDKDGYLDVTLSVDGELKYKRVHRLVLENFEPTKEDLQVNHKNGIKDDNRIENLEWVTPSENAIHSLHTLGNVNTLDISGLNKPKKVHKINKQGKIIKVYPNMRLCESEENISRNTLNKYSNNGLLYKNHYWKVIE